MAVNISNFFSPDRGLIARFDNVGDVVSGTIVDVELVDDKFNPGRQALKVKLSNEGVVTDLYVRSPGMKEAVHTAVTVAGTDAIDVGGELSMTYTGDKPISGGRSMKTYSAVYNLPAPTGDAEVVDVF